MKNIFQIFIFIFFMQSCHPQELKIDYETIEIDIPGSPGPWLKHNSKYYCYFQTDNDKFSSGSNHNFYILDEEGKVNSKISVPEKLQTYYYDLYIKNDSIFTTEYYNHHTFYLDEKNKKWIETKKGIDLVYEDKEYTVYTRDFGEWGGITWFKDNLTHKQYEIAATNPVINKFDNAYYLTTSKFILKISDPKKLEISKEAYDYKKAVLAERYFREGSNSMKGGEMIYIDTTDVKSKYSIATSFIANNKFYHLFNDGISTKIGIVENKKLTPILDLKSDLRPFKWYYDTRNPIQNNQYQTIQFSIKGKNNFGIIEINKNHINVTSFKNSYKEPIMGEDQTKEWVQTNFDYFYSNLNTLSLNQIDDIEQKENATDLTQSHKISNYILDGKDIETPRIYRKKESPFIHLITMYYYTTREKSIELIEFQWGIKSHFDSVEESQTTPNIDTQKLYKSKFDWLFAFLMQKLGKPILNNQDKENATVKWKNGNKSVELSLSKYIFELRLYKS
ncbi:hypothetical protein [Chryseobacterium sp. LAM-KRS1]|uniref:hypothetical protein n=2 Tax=Chryseobacterium TaxID=59732 RepID=UPI001557C78C|nr:hypothetical protein [Chryseobacterium sp. LAM-KRS1]